MTGTPIGSFTRIAPSLKDSGSEGVRSLGAADEVLGFGGGQFVAADADDLFEFVAIDLVDLPYLFGRGRERIRSETACPYHGTVNDAAGTRDMASHLRERAADRRRGSGTRLRAPFRAGGWP